jgi:uncharacterized membrane protein YoaK (UPF0700 family)
LSWSSFLRDAASVETERLRSQVRDAVRSLVLGVVAGILFLVAVVFVLTGAYASLSEHLPAWQAGGVVGLSTLVVCLFLLLLSKGSGARPASRRRYRRPSAEDLEATAELGAAASDAARDFVRDHRPSGVQLTLAAFVAGLLASRRSRRRDSR